MAFSSMDSSIYNEALGQYQSSLNSALDSASAANALAKGKVDQFNTTLQTTLSSLSAPVIAKGFGKSLQNVKSALGKKAGQYMSKARQAVEDKANELREQAQSTVNKLVNRNQANPDGPIEGDQPQRSAQEEDETDPQEPLEPEDVEDTNVDDVADALRLDPESDENPLSLQEPRTVSQDAVDPVADDAANSLESATDGAQAAGTDAVNALSNAAKGGTEAITDGVTDGLATTDAVVDTTAAAEGGLNPVADLAVLGVGLGMLFTGLFAHKHTPSPTQVPPAINPTFSFGA